MIGLDHHNIRNGMYMEIYAMLTYLTTKSLFYWYVSAKTLNSSTPPQTHKSPPRKKRKKDLMTFFHVILRAGQTFLTFE